MLVQLMMASSFAALVNAQRSVSKRHDLEWTEARRVERRGDREAAPADVHLEAMPAEEVASERELARRHRVRCRSFVSIYELVFHVPYCNMVSVHVSVPVRMHESAHTDTSSSMAQATNVTNRPVRSWTRSMCMRKRSTAARNVD